MRKLLVFLLALGAVGGGVGWWIWSARAGPRANFRMASVTRGKLQATIKATGTIQPEEVIDVGAQVAGRIKSFGGAASEAAMLDKPPAEAGKQINYGSVVEEGTVLAHLDAALYEARRDAAKADLVKAEADLLQQKAKEVQAKRDMDRAEK